MNRSFLFHLEVVSTATRSSWLSCTRLFHFPTPLSTAWTGPEGQLTTKCVCFELVLEDGLFQGRICLAECYWKVMNTIGRSLIKNLKNTHKVSLTISQSQRRIVLSGSHGSDQTGAVGVSEVAPSKRHWVTEDLSSPINVEVRKIHRCNHASRVPAHRRQAVRTYFTHISHSVDPCHDQALPPPLHCNNFLHCH